MSPNNPQDLPDGLARPIHVFQLGESDRETKVHRAPPPDLTELYDRLDKTERRAIESFDKTADSLLLLREAVEMLSKRLSALEHLVVGNDDS